MFLPMSKLRFNKEKEISGLVRSRPQCVCECVVPVPVQVCRCVFWKPGLQEQNESVPFTTQ